MPDFSPQIPLNYVWDNATLMVHSYEGTGEGICAGASSAHNLSINLGDTPTLLGYGTTGAIQRNVIGPGALFVIPSNVESYWEARNNSQADVLHIDFSTELWDKTAQNMALDPLQWTLCDRLNTYDPLVEQIGRALLNEALSGGWSGTLYRDSLLQALIVHLIRNYSNRQLTTTFTESGLSKQALGIVIDYIQDNLAHDLSLQTLADQVFLSPFYFARQFKVSTGQSPHQYVIAQRIERAKALIRAGQLPLAGVADAVGFANQSHLNRHFKRLVGITPAQFR